MNAAQRHRLRKKRSAKRQRILKDSERLQCQLWREWVRITPSAIPSEEMVKLLKLYPLEDE